MRLSKRIYKYISFTGGGVQREELQDDSHGELVQERQGNVGYAHTRVQQGPSGCDHPGNPGNCRRTVRRLIPPFLI